MKVNWKELVRRVLLAVFTGLFLGFFFVILLFSISFMAPPYVQRASWVLLPCLLAGAVLAILFPRRWRKGVALCLAAVTVGCGAYCALGFWRNSIPTVDDRDLLLWQYEPFSEDTKAVSLEEEPTLRFRQEDLLRLDGATALYPVYASFVQAIYPQGEYPRYDSSRDGYGLVTCSGTVEAYKRLITGRADLIFAAAPSQDQLEMARRAAKELHLTPIGREYGLVQDDRWAKYQHTQQILEAERRRLHETHLRTADLRAAMEAVGLAPAAEGGIAEELLRRPEISYPLVAGIIGWGEEITPMLAERLETEIKYAGYIARQDRMIREVARHEKTLIPEDFEYAALTGLTLEAREKLARIRPRNLGQAGRIPGVSPSDVAQLSIALAGKQQK